MASGDIQQILKLVTQLDSSGMNQLRNELDLTADKAEKSGSRMGTALKIGAAALATGGLAVAAGLADAVKQASAFDDSLLKTQALAGASKDEMDGYRQGILDLTKQIPVSANEMADSLFYVKSAGFQGADALNILKIAGEASAAGLGQMPVVVDAVTSALNAYKLSGQDASKITDILTTAVTDGKASADTFAPALGRILPLASAMGVSFDQVAASMATMTRVGLSTDEASTALRGTLSALEKPGKDAQEALASIGLSADDLKKSIADKGLLATLQDLMDRTNGNVDTLDHIIPNVRALTGVLATAGQQGDTYNKILTDMQHANGATDKAFQTMQSSMSFNVKLLRNDFNAAMIEIGGKILPMITPAIHAAALALPGIIDQVEGAISTWAPRIVAAVMPVIQVVQQTVGGVTDWLFDDRAGSGGIGLISRAQELIGPIVEGVTSIKVRVLDAVGGVQEWLFGGSSDTTQSRFDRMSSLFEGVVFAAGMLAGVLKQDLVPILGALADFVVTKLVPALASIAFDYYANLARVLVFALTSTLIPVLGQLSDFAVKTLIPALNRLGDWITTTLVPAFNTLSTYISDRLIVVLLQLGTFILTVVLPPLLKLADWIIGTLIPVLAQIIGQVIDHVMPTFDKWIHQITDEILPAFIEFATVLIGRIEQVVGFVTEHWPEIYAVIKPALDALVIVVTATWDNIKTIIQTVLNVIGDILKLGTDLLKGNWKDAWDDVKKIVSDIWDGIKAIAETAWKEIHDLILGPIKDVVTQLGDKATGLLGSIWGGITGVFQDMWSWFKNQWSDITNVVTAPFTWIANNIGGIVSPISAALFAPFKLVYSGLDSFVRGTSNAVNWILGHLDLPQWKTDWSMPALPAGLARGTDNWGGGLAWVGEAGAELALLPAGAKVMPHRDAMSLVTKGLVAPPSMARNEGSGWSGGAQLPGFLFGLDGDDLVNKFKDAVGDIASFARQWVGKGAEALVNAAYDTAGLKGFGATGALAGVGNGIFTTVKDSVIDATKQMLGIASKALPPVGGFLYPVSGPITQGFGPAAADVASLEPGGMHQGVDFGVPSGTTVSAAAGGKVQVAGPYGGLGIAVKIDSGGNLTETYGHLADTLVAVGDTITAGQSIAHSDNTGVSTGPHLHFQVELNGQPVDPMPYLTGAAGGAVSGSLADWLEQAAAIALGRQLTQQELSAQLWLANQESSGNPAAVNPAAVVSGGIDYGHATGLLQMLPTTFLANALPGHGDILNPVDNAAASYRYQLHTYGDLLRAAANEQSGAAGYAHGGIIEEPIIGFGLNTGQRYTFGERGDEMIVPLDSNEVGSTSNVASAPNEARRARLGRGESITPDPPKVVQVYGQLDFWGWEIIVTDDGNRQISWRPGAQIPTYAWDVVRARGVIQPGEITALMNAARAPTWTVQSRSGAGVSWSAGATLGSSSADVPGSTYGGIKGYGFLPVTLGDGSTAHVLAAPGQAGDTPGAAGTLSASGKTGAGGKPDTYGALSAANGGSTAPLSADLLGSINRTLGDIGATLGSAVGELRLIRAEQTSFDDFIGTSVYQKISDIADALTANPTMHFAEGAIQIPAADISEMQSISDFFNRVQQEARAKGMVAS